MTDQQTIPKIIHQTWKTDTIPEDLQLFQQTWHHHHPDWAYRLWTDADNRVFIEAHYDWFLPTYDGYDQNIKRADAIRYFMMLHYGGLYVDLDFECLRPFETLLAGKSIALGLEPPPHAEPYTEKWGYDQLICNALIGSEPHHPFWEHVCRMLISEAIHVSPIEATGPVFLTHAYHTFAEKESLSTIPHHLIYPVTNEESSDVRRSTKKLHAMINDEAYALHYWFGTWQRESLFALVRARMKKNRTAGSGQ